MRQDPTVAAGHAAVDRVVASEDAERVVPRWKTLGASARALRAVRRASALATLAVATLTLAPGCASSQATVPVIHSRPAVVPLDRAYLVVFQGQLDAVRTERLRQALGDALAPRTTALVTMVVSGLELDEPTARADIDAFHPDGVLVIKPTGAASRQPGEGDDDAVTYDVAVLAPKGKRTVWHASLVSEGGPGLMARDLVDHLTAEGLLRPTSAPQPSPAAR